jgi:hypothetical protein
MGKTGQVIAKYQPAEVNVKSMKPGEFGTKWTSISDELKGGTIYIGSNGGVAEIEVLDSGHILLALNYDYQGNPSGGWKEEAWSKAKFLSEGWRHHENLELASSEKRKFIIVSKYCQKGTRMKLRCKKYEPPYVIFLP